MALLAITNGQRQRRRRREDERDITPEEVLEMADDKTIEDDPDMVARNELMTEWD